MLKKIGVIYGAVRKGRKSIRAARALVQALENREGVEVHLFDIRDYGLGVMESRLKDMSDPPPLLVEISEKIKSMDGLVFMTPEYNNSYSGAMKNFVDYFTFEWAKKPIGISCVSSGKMGGVRAAGHLQMLILGINALPMPYQWLVPLVEQNLDDQGNIQQEALEKSLERFVSELLDFVGQTMARRGD